MRELTPSLSRKHIDRLHDCQICTIAGCTQSFGSKGELYRHKQTRHNQILPNKLLKCPEQGCKYAGVPHFKRKDNLVEHLKRMHNLGQIEAKAAADSEAKIQFQARVCGHQSIPSVAIDASLPDGASASLFAPGDSPYSQNLPTQSVYGIMPGLSKKRCFNQALPEQSDLLSGQLVSFDGAPDDIETLRRKAAKLEADLQALQVEHTSVLANQEILKKENDRLKTNVDSLIAVLAANRKP